jgi:hypothetical protein
MAMQFTAVYLNPESWRAAKELGKASKTSAGAVVRVALDQYLNRAAKAGLFKHGSQSAKK